MATRFCWIPEFNPRGYEASYYVVSEGESTHDANKAIQFDTEAECELWIKNHPGDYRAVEHGFCDMGG